MRQHRREIWTAVGTAGLTLLLLVPVLQLWRADLGVPFGLPADPSLSGDGHFFGMVAKGIIEHGGYNHNAALGAPFGQALADFPLGGDHLHLLVLRLLALFSSSYAVAVNLFFLLTFPLTALSALFVLRWLGINRRVSAVFAVLFAFAPYHFARGEAHLFLSGYFAVPLGVYLAMAILSGRPLFEQRSTVTAAGVAGRLRAWLSPRTLMTMLVCAVVASSDAYYAAFTLILVVAAAAVARLRSGSADVLRPAALVVAAIVATLALNQLPTVLHHAAHGPNPLVAVRAPSESEIFGLKIVQLLLPAGGHRLGPLAHLAEIYRTSTQIPSENGQALGAIGALGFLFLLGVAVMGLAGGVAGRAIRPLHRQLAVLTVVAVGVSTMGGFSSLIAYLATPQIRSWNRMSIFIAFLALAAVAAVVDSALARATSGRARMAATAALAALLLVGILDQTNGSMVPAYAEVAADFRSDAAFVSAIERQLAPRSMVFQLPYRAFPEEGPHFGMVDYDLLRGYLHSRHLRWSYGGIRGREADWQEALQGQPPGLLLARLGAAGFAGITVDRFGYADRGHAAEADLSARLGPPMVSPNGRLSFFTLTAAADRLRRNHAAADVRALAEDTLHPVVARWGAGFGQPHVDDSGRWIRFGPDSHLRLENPGREARRVVLDATVQPETSGADEVQVRYPDGRAETLHLSPTGTSLHRELLVPPGTSEVSLRVVPPTLTPPGGDPRLRLADPAVYTAPPPAFAASAATADPTPSWRANPALCAGKERLYGGGADPSPQVRRKSCR